MPFLDLCNGIGTFKRLDATHDASRGPVAAYDTLYEDVPIRVDDLGGGQEMIWGQQVWVATHIAFYTPPGELRNGDILVTEGLTLRLINPQLARAAGTLDDHAETYCMEMAP